MLEYKIVNAKEKDIEILTSIKLITMIDDEIDKSISYKEKNKIRENIIKNIEDTYQDYKLIYVDKKIAGAYYVMPYENGYMIDEIYLFKEYRNNGIGESIINKLKKDKHILYVWIYKNNKVAIKFFKRLGFVEVQSGRTLIMKYDNIYETIKDKLDDIKLGYRDKEGNKYLGYGKNFKETFYLQNPKQLLESKVGTCFDQVELERELISKFDFMLRTYFIFYQDDILDISHTFLVYKDGKNYCWLENAWLKYRGLHCYDTKEELITDVVNKFIETVPNGDIKKVKLYLYEKPRFGINYGRFLSYVMNGKNIRVKYN